MSAIWFVDLSGRGCKTSLISFSDRNFSRSDKGSLLWSIWKIGWRFELRGLFIHSLSYLAEIRFICSIAFAFTPELNDIFDHFWVYFRSISGEKLPESFTKLNGFQWWFSACFAFHAWVNTLPSKKINSWLNLFPFSCFRILVKYRVKADEYVHAVRAFRIQLFYDMRIINKGSFMIFVYQGCMLNA